MVNYRLYTLHENISDSVASVTFKVEISGDLLGADLSKVKSKGFTFERPNTENNFIYVKLPRRRTWLGNDTHNIAVLENHFKELGCEPCPTI